MMPFRALCFAILSLALPLAAEPASAEGSGVAAVPEALSPAAAVTEPQPVSPAAAAPTAPAGLIEPGAVEGAEVIEAPPTDVQVSPVEVEALPKETAPKPAVPEKPEPRFKARNFLLGFLGGAALGAVFAPMGQMPEWQGAAIGGPSLGLLALLLGATTAPEAKPPTVNGLLPATPLQPLPAFAEEPLGPGYGLTSPVALGSVPQLRFRFDF